MSTHNIHFVYGEIRKITTFSVGEKKSVLSGGV